VGGYWFGGTYCLHFRIEVILICILKMEVVCSSETLVATCETAVCQLEGHSVNLCCHENLKSCALYSPSQCVTLSFRSTLGIFPQQIFHAFLVFPIWVTSTSQHNSLYLISTLSCETNFYEPNTWCRELSYGIDGHSSFLILFSNDSDFSIEQPVTIRLKK
jgi:hypothetical protein